MNNFLKFIDEDIEAKKTLFSSMPTKTKTNIRKFDKKIDEVSGKYKIYKVAVKKYLDTKSKSFSIGSNVKELDKLRERVTTLERVRFILNPTNTYFEKMGFDNLLFQISNYYDFNFSSLNNIINQFLDKFELAGIKLPSGDFDYTCYVRQYMTSFLEVRNKKSKSYSKVSEIFEKIYWANPEIIQHIELNFRKLIKEFEKKFVNYIIKLQRTVKLENKVSDYEDCLDQLKVTYNELDIASRENISDIIDLAKEGTIDINNYFEDSKVRTGAYTSLMVDPSKLDDKIVMDKFYDNLEKLKINIEEYDNYIKVTPLIKDFKNEYEKQIPSDEKNSNKGEVSKNLKSIESQINEKEAKLRKTNKKIFSDKDGFFKSRNNEVKQLKIDSIKQAKELYDLYKLYDEEYFKDKVLSILSDSLLVSELLHLYYSFDYFKKITIKKVFNITNYDEIIKYSDEFDLFAMNPNNVIIDGILLFEETDVAKIIMNKYRLDNINLTEEVLNSGDLNSLLEKIKLLLRVKKIGESEMPVEKIWFMAQVEKFNKIENKKE
ncbi:MAG: hypothetical protein WDA21_03415 [Bacilli bacterium]